jgi:hypothetical protein
MTQPLPIGSAYPAHREHPAAWPTIDDVLRLLAPGDRIRWNERKQPLKVQSEDERSGNTRPGSGAWDIAWSVEGPRGGEYAAFVWYHWKGDNYETWGDSVKAWPQAYRTTEGWEDRTGFELLATDAPIWCQAVASPSNLVVPSNGDWIAVYSHPATDRRVWGRVDRVEFGQPVIDPLGVWPAVETEHTIDWGQIVAWRDKA